MPELFVKPCPCCGGKSGITDSGTMKAVVCSSCGLMLVYLGNNATTAVSNWNRRTKYVKPKKPPYIRHAVYALDEVLPFVSPKDRVYKGFTVGMCSYRYRTYAAKGTVCVTCGRQGTYFALEHCKDQKDCPPHFNLYGKDEDGTEFMMTVDHILPKSHGGRNEVENLQPMCCECNLKKGNKIS